MGLALFHLGRLLHESRSDADKSESVARRAVDLHRQLAEESNEFKDELAIDLDLLGSVLAYQSKRYDEAAAAYTESLDLRFQLHGAADHDLIAWLYQHLGYTENRRGNFSASDAWYCKGLDTRRRLGDSAGTPIRVLLGSWVDALQSRGDYGACEKLIEAESPSVKTRASLFNRVAWRMLTDGSKANVEPAMEFALRANELTSFDDAVYLDTLALAQHRSGESEAALETQQKALRILAPGCICGEGSIDWHAAPTGSRVATSARRCTAIHTSHSRMRAWRWHDARPHHAVRRRKPGWRSP